MCDPSFIPFSGTRITIMPLQLRLKVIKGHWTLFQGHNIISKSRILILKMIGPSNTYTLAPWAPLNWKKCCLVIPCAMCPLPCLLWYSDDSTRTFHVAFLLEVIQGHWGSFTDYVIFKCPYTCQFLTYDKLWPLELCRTLCWTCLYIIWWPMSITVEVIKQ